MKIANKTLLLFFVIILEGYVVLSCEMLALRQSVPFVGSGTDTVSIIIAAVLMPLACGYYFGGRFRATGRRSIRKKLVYNIIVSQAILLVGLSYYTLNIFFYSLLDLGITNRLALTTLYSLAFLVTPVFLLGQTIPLVSNYFSKEKLAKITGRMLFFSTLGSFLGAVFSTLVLMATIGVHYTAAILIALLCLLTLMLSKKIMSDLPVYSAALALAAFFINSEALMRTLHVVEDNQYNTVAVFEEPDGDRHMILNNNASSLYNDSGRKHEYIEFAEKMVIDPIRDAAEPRDILVIGAGAFTFGFEDHFNNYDFVDLDKSLKDIAEEQILRAKLTENKHFIPMEARAYLAQTQKKYDAIFLDAYAGDLSLPEQLVTREFYGTVKDHLREGGVVVSNFIMSPNFESPFSRHLDDTFRSVFPYVSRYVIGEQYMPWNSNSNLVVNVIYLYRRHADERPEIYTDDKNRVFYDKPHSRSAR